MAEQIIKISASDWQTFYFREYAIQSSVDVNIVEQVDLGGETSQESKLFIETLEGTEVCQGVKFYAQIFKQEVITFTAGVGIAPGVTQVIPHPDSAITVRISWLPFTATPTTPYTPPANPSTTPDSYVDAYTEISPEEWLELMTILRTGVNQRCRDRIHYRTYGQKKGDPIVNSMVTTKAQARRIGQVAIEESSKNRDIILYPPLNLNLVRQLSTWIKIYIEQMDADIIEQIEGFEIKSQGNKDTFFLYLRAEGDE